MVNNVVGFHMAQDPAPIMVLQPTLTMAEAWSKDRLAPMIRDTPALAEIFGLKTANDNEPGARKSKAKDAGDTILHKKFPGGQITIAGANSPASLASRPIRIVLCDEVDRYPPSAGAEGDPVSLVAKRASTFWNRKIGLFSTPTVKGASRIEASWEESDQRRYFVPCPHCQHRQYFRWAQVKWDEGKPETAAYYCEECGCAWTEAQRLRAVRLGEWQATKPFFRHAGFHLNQLASPWTTVHEIVAAFLEAKKFPETLKTWVNTVLAETWEEAGDGVEGDGLLNRLEEYEADPVPAGVALITAGVDIQDDRFEVEIIGFGANQETWSLEYIRQVGDPATPGFWRLLDEILLRRYRHPSGRELRIEAACVDSGGHFTTEVYDFCRPRWGRRVFAIKGKGGEGVPIWPQKATRNAAKNIAVFLIGVDTAKETIYARLTIADQGPGYCHFPTRYPPEYFDGLTVEKRVRKYRHGHPYHVWEKPNGARNEPLDCRVYGIAARHSLSVDVDRRAEALAKAAEGDNRPMEALAPRRRGIRSRGVAA